MDPSTNPYATEPQINEGSIDVVPPQELTQAQQQPRRIWTSWIVLLVTTVVYLMVSVVCWVAGALWLTGGSGQILSGSPEEMASDLLEHPGTLSLVLLPAQVSLFGVAIFAAFLSSEGIRKRLGFVQGRWSLLMGCCIAAATPFISLLTSIVMAPFVESSEHLDMLTGAFRIQHEQGYLWLLLVLIGCLPAICEEVLFRGYLQRGLLRRWNPILAICVTSFCFAAFHMDLVHSTAVLPLGLWLGFLAWYSKSLWPAILGHFINNVTSVITSLPEDSGVFDMPSPEVTVAVLAFGIIGVGVLIYDVVSKRSRIAENDVSLETMVE